MNKNKFLNGYALFMAIVYITACGINRVTPNLFSKGEHIVVNYSSQGCFHSFSNILVFHENNVTIYKATKEWNQKVSKSKIGILVLSQKDEEGLNKLFAYYNEKLDDGCTSVDEIEIKRYKNKKLIFSKKIIDASCGLDQKEDVLSFFELIGRVRE